MYKLDNGMTFETAAEAAEFIIETFDDELYDDMLDECYGVVEVCGYTYTASHALYYIDRVAYNCGKNDYYDSIASDIAYELDRMSDGDVDNFYGFEIEFVEDIEED